MSPTPPSNRDAAADELVETFAGSETSLADLVDSLLEKGVVVDGEVVLGLAGIDLIYLRLAALLAAADRVMETGHRGAGSPVGGAEPRDAAAGASQDGRAGSPNPPDRQGARSASASYQDPLKFVDIPEVDSKAERHPLSVHAAPPESIPSPAASAGEPVSRWNPDPREVRKGVMKLVLALAEFIRQLLERQAVRRMEAGTLTDAEVERLGTALAQVEDTLRDIAESAGLDPSEINLDLGPLGKLI
jgi:hypothetical protein